MDRVNRRQLLRLTGASVGAGALAGCLGGDGDGQSGDGATATTTQSGGTAATSQSGGGGGGETTELHIVEPEGAITIPMYLYGTDQGAWTDNNIKLSTEVAAFGKFTRQLTQNLSNIAGFSAMYAIQFMDEGAKPMTTIGQQLNFYNQIMAKNGSGIEKPGDLSDAHLGVPFKDSQTTRVVRAMILDEYDFDILNDPAKVTSSPPPALWNLFTKGELDATLEFSGYTLAGNAAEDVHTVFDSFAYWKDRTGQPPSVADFVVYKDWLEQNPQVALNYLKGWWKAVGIFNEQTSAALDQYGRLGGVTSKAQQKVVKQWVNDGIVAPLESGYSQELADSTYKLMQLLAKHDLLEGVPDDPNTLFTTTSELKDMI